MPNTEWIPTYQRSYGQQEERAALEVLRNGPLARGPRVEAFEAACAERLRAGFAVACSSGSSALELALRGLQLGPKDSVLVPTVAPLATAMAVRAVGARPIFMDVDPATHNIGPANLRSAWTSDTRAVLAVDMAGVPCPTRAIRALAVSRGAFVVQDASQSLGAHFAGGMPVGSDGAAHVTAFGLDPEQTITTGEGGLVTCSDPELAERMRNIRNGGVQREFPGSQGQWDYYAQDVGASQPMSELQAALGLAQLERLDDLLEARRNHCSALLQGLGDIPGLSMPVHRSGSSRNRFVVELSSHGHGPMERESVQRYLQAQGIGTSVHYPLLHRQPVFDALYQESELGAAVRYADRALSLPLFADMTTEQIDRIVVGMTGAMEQLVQGARISA